MVLIEQIVAKPDQRAPEPPSGQESIKTVQPLRKMYNDKTAKEGNWSLAVILSASKVIALLAV